MDIGSSLTHLVLLLVPMSISDNLNITTHVIFHLSREDSGVGAQLRGFFQPLFGHWDDNQARKMIPKTRTQNRTEGSLERWIFLKLNTHYLCCFPVFVCIFFTKKSHFHHSAFVTFTYHTGSHSRDVYHLYLDQIKHILQHNLIVRVSGIVYDTHNNGD